MKKLIKSTSRLEWLFILGMALAVAIGLYIGLKYPISAFAEWVKEARK